MKDKIKQLLGQGHSQVLVANAVGCSEAYISELMGVPEFSSEVTKLRIQFLEAATSRDNEIDSIEDQLIEKLKSTLPYLVKPSDIIRTFAVINRAERRGQPQQANKFINETHVHLHLPESIKKTFILDSRAQVVQVDDVPLLTATPNQLAAMITVTNQEKQLTAEEKYGLKTPKQPATYNYPLAIKEGEGWDISQVTDHPDYLESLNIPERSLHQDH